VWPLVPTGGDISGTLNKKHVTCEVVAEEEASDGEAAAKAAGSKASPSAIRTRKRVLGNWKGEITLRFRFHEIRTNEFNWQHRKWIEHAQTPQTREGN
jgi:hypothetical protein